LIDIILLKYLLKEKILLDHDSLSTFNEMEKAGDNRSLPASNVHIVIMLLVRLQLHIVVKVKIIWHIIDVGTRYVL
jgi:hypothetical protein